MNDDLVSQLSIANFMLDKYDESTEKLKTRIAELEVALLYYAKMKTVCQHDDTSWCDHCPDGGKRARKALGDK